MNIRKLTEADYEALEKWWKAWDWPPIEKDFYQKMVLVD